MIRDEVIKNLNAHRRELEALGVDHLYVFGSVARGDSTGASDVDLLAEFNPVARIGFAFAGIRSRLEEMLGLPVDLLAAPVEKPSLRRRIESEAVRAF